MWILRASIQYYVEMKIILYTSSYICRDENIRKQIANNRLIFRRKNTVTTMMMSAMYIMAKGKYNLLRTIMLCTYDDG